MICGSPKRMTWTQVSDRIIYPKPDTFETAKKSTFPYKMNISWAGLTLADSTQENIMQKSKK